MVQLQTLLNFSHNIVRAYEEKSIDGVTARSNQFRCSCAESNMVELGKLLRKCALCSATSNLARDKVLQCVLHRTCGSSISIGTSHLAVGSHSGKDLQDNGGD